MNSEKCKKIAKWFIDNYEEEWTRDKRLLSWSEKLGVCLNMDGEIDNNQLFQLFVLAVLWNNGETAGAEAGKIVFYAIKDKYTLENFITAADDQALAERLRTIHPKLDRDIFNLLSFIVNGQVRGTSIWTRIKNILDSPNIGVKESDERRLTNLYNLFNPIPQEIGKAFLTVKTFLIFREIRIQFHNFDKYQYHTAVCCVPDSHVKKALAYLNILRDDPGKKRIDNLIATSERTAELFCTENHELYDLPLFFWDLSGRPNVDNYS